MKVALLFNLNRRDSQAELEFDLPTTIDGLQRALETKHIVRRIECDRDLSKWVAELTTFDPDSIFSVAEGFSGAAREAFYPALFEQLGIPYSGSDPTTMLFAQNKALTKSIAAKAGVQTPRWFVASDRSDLVGDNHGLCYPLLVKPNSEGSSIGIDKGAVVRNSSQLEERVQFVWNKLHNLALVEEYISAGHDLSVSYVEGLGDEIFGPVGYDIGADDLYDYQWKSQSYLYPDIVVEPVRLSNATRELIRQDFRKLVRLLDVRGYARGDFRVTPDEKSYFLEVNAQVELAEKAEFAVPIVRAGHGFHEIVLHIAEGAHRAASRLPSHVGSLML